MTLARKEIQRFRFGREDNNSDISGGTINVSCQILGIPMQAKFNDIPKVKSRRSSVVVLLPLLELCQLCLCDT